MDRERLIEELKRDEGVELKADQDTEGIWTIGIGRNLQDARQRVCINMCFNLGLTRLLGFKKFLAAMAAGDWETAGVEMLDSKWSRQVGARSTRLKDLLLEG